jgi:Rad3-related DNA helicase
MQTYKLRSQKPPVLRTIDATITPDLLGLPEKFTEFRQGQLYALDRSIVSDKRFIGHAMPTGSGKSLYYIAQALMEGKRVAVLTSTKGLQDQLLADFASIGLVSVKGKNNFDCVEHDGKNCEEGSHLKCPAAWEKPDPMNPHPCRCPYRLQFESAVSSSLIVTNYAYWTSIYRYGQGLGTFDMLVLDEAHDAPDEITSALAITLSTREVLGMLRTAWPKQPLYLKGWQEFAAHNLPTATAHYSKLQASVQPYMTHSSDVVRSLMAYRNLVSKLTNLSTIRGEWVVETLMKNGEPDGYKIECVWPYTYSEEILFLQIPRVILVSGTLVPRTFQLLGVQSGFYAYHQYPSSFPGERSPVYHLPTVKLNHKSTSEDYWLLIQRIDEIIGKRLDRKGIIHTTSYDRAQRILERSQYARYMVTHTNRSGEAMQAAETFRRLPPPAVLISPSVTTGYDFPFDTCEYQIIAKAPYPDLRAKVQYRRMERDRLYPAYQMAQVLVQAAGRGMRAPTDRCETFILDGAVHDVVERTPRLFPEWFLSLYQEIADVPPPPPLVTDQDEEFSR